MAQNTAVIGLQWGDEGKGKLVDILAESHDLLIAFDEEMFFIFIKTFLIYLWICRCLVGAIFFKKSSDFLYRGVFAHLAISDCKVQSLTIVDKLSVFIDLISVK